MLVVLLPQQTVQILSSTQCPERHHEAPETMNEPNQGSHCLGQEVRTLTACGS